MTAPLSARPGVKALGDGETLAEEFDRLLREYREPDTDGTQAEAWNLIADFAVENATTILSALSEPGQQEAVARVIAEGGEDGAACGWSSCTGCHETNEGYSVGCYPVSPIFECEVGSGCSECGGIGVVWNYITKDQLDEWSKESTTPQPDKTAALEAEIAELRKDAERYRWLRKDTEGRSNRWPQVTQYPHQTFDAFQPPQISRNFERRGEYLDEAIDAGMAAPPEELLTEHALAARALTKDHPHAE